MLLVLNLEIVLELWFCPGGKARQGIVTGGLRSNVHKINPENGGQQGNLGNREDGGNVPRGQGAGAGLAADSWETQV